MTDFDDLSNDDDHPRRPVPDPLDRVWRHPSELAGPPRAAGATRSRRAPRPRRARPSSARPAGRARVAIPALSAVAGAGLTLLLVTVFGSVDLDRQPSLDAGGSDPAPPEASLVANRLAPSVVAITARDGDGLRRGSGIVVRPEGEVLTNARLVGWADRVDVITVDGTRVTASIVGIDRDADLALVRVDAPLIAAPVSTGMPGIGQTIYAVAADRSGRTTPRISRGIVSSTDGLVATPGGPAMSGLIEIDTLADAEWAGGALVDSDGEALGILFAPTSESRRTFALPLRYADEIAARLRVDGLADHGHLGVHGVDTADGPVVWTVDPDAPAAGLAPGDLVLTVGGRSVDTMAEVTAVVRRAWPGDQIDVEVRRAGRRVVVDVTLGGGDPPTTAAAPDRAPADDGTARRATMGA